MGKRKEKWENGEKKDKGGKQSKERNNQNNLINTLPQGFILRKLLKKIKN